MERTGALKSSDRTWQHWPLWRGAFLALLLCAGPALRAEPVSKERQLKAAFLYHFAKFVEWPEQCFASPDAPLVIGVFGANPFGDALEQAVRDRKINGHGIVVKQVHQTSAARTVHVLFISAAEAPRVGDLKEFLQGASVLTVGETETFMRQGGMINFVLEGDKLRFEINVDAAAEAALKISAQLQKLARAIRRKS